MLTKAEAAARVAKGAALLDERSAGWAERIDVGRLSLRNDNCILGQLYGSFVEGHTLFTREEWVAAAKDIRLAPTRQHGFNAGTENLGGHLVLQDAWIAAIADRLTPDAPEPADAKLEAVTA